MNDDRKFFESLESNSRLFSFSVMRGGMIKVMFQRKLYDFLHDVNFGFFERLKSDKDQNSFTMESLILAQDER